MPSSEESGDNRTRLFRRMRIVIIGAGLGGLGAAIALKRKGHEVTVLEAASKLSEIGAGIQIPPNSSRILKAYGLDDRFRERVAWPQNIAIRRFDSGNILGLTPLHPRMTKLYGHAYWLIHRADYQRILYDAAVEMGVKVYLSTRISSVDVHQPSVTSQNGHCFRADLIVGADGIRSRTREFVIPDTIVKPNSSSNAAFRAIVPAEYMLSDPEAAHLMNDVNANCWIGYQRHIMAYPIQQGALYNLIMSHPGEPGQVAAGIWNEPGNLDDMRATYADFDSVIRRVLSKVKSCLKWKLADLPSLSSWVSESGKVVLLGDAAHAMVPYMAQGASMAIEDGAALAECLDRVEKLDDIPRYLKAFEKIRKSRCEKIQECSRLNGNMWHMHDGPGQEARDRALALDDLGDDAPTEAQSSSSNPNLWSDKEFQPWLFGHDVFVITNRMLDEMESGES